MSQKSCWNIWNVTVQFGAHAKCCWEMLSKLIAFYVSRATFWSKLWWNFFSIFFFFGLYVKHFSMDLPKLPSSCPDEHTEPIFQKSSKKFFRSFSEKVLAGVVKTTCVFNLSRAAISAKKNSKNSRKVTNFLEFERISKTGVLKTNCLVHVQNNSNEKFLIFSKTYTFPRFLNEHFF